MNRFNLSVAVDAAAAAAAVARRRVLEIEHDAYLQELNYNLCWHPSGRYKGAVNHGRQNLSGWALFALKLIYMFVITVTVKPKLMAFFQVKVSVNFVLDYVNIRVALNNDGYWLLNYKIPYFFFKGCCRDQRAEDAQNFGWMSHRALKHEWNVSTLNHNKNVLEVVTCKIKHFTTFYVHGIAAGSGRLSDIFANVLFYM